ncbi:hypothetical protein EDF18_1361 [Frigoribacterium sp. PhB107]|uniref:hypothetical protein n=1 Tax=Frigoribacterium sp. PhB107 TaxID=2485172 RepID=UPI000FB83456|nr:hypothetical protein [Frigoribacterium sp. PhB107]ROP78705.1 hypothetical protein EDF18_1361 [Frigoribacterium sp. PhB107]
MASSSHRAHARLRTTPLAVVTGLVAAVLMALTMSGTLSAFTASIANANNTATTGTLLMREVGTPGATCYSNGAESASVSSNGNTATCTSNNKFGAGGTLKPGTTRNVPVTISNVGTMDAGTFTLANTGACVPGKTGDTSGTATDICSKITLVLTQGGTSVYSGTLADLGARTTPISLTAVPAGQKADMVFSVTLDGAVGNDYQGLTATVPLKWTFTA